MSDLHHEKENDVVHNTPPSASESVSVAAKVNNEPSGTSPKASVWGEHLNKPNFSLESTTPKSATPSSSNTSSYSKLTQKLMKGIIKHLTVERYLFIIFRDV